MKNAPFYLLIAVVASVIALMIFWIYLSAVGGALPENSVGGLCTILFLIFAVIGYELLTKPGLYSRKKKVEPEEQREDGGGKNGASP